MNNSPGFEEKARFFQRYLAKVCSFPDIRQDSDLEACCFPVRGVTGKSGVFALQQDTKGSEQDILPNFQLQSGAAGW